MEMEFEYLHKLEKNAIEAHGYYISHIDRFYNFIDEFNAVGVHWGQPTNISAAAQSIKTVFFIVV